MGGQGSDTCIITHTHTHTHTYTHTQDLTIPKLTKAAIDEEMEKLEALEKNSSEFNVTRNYLEWLTSLPWGVMSKENFDLKRAKVILDEDHYGLQGTHIYTPTPIVM